MKGDPLLRLGVFLAWQGGCVGTAFSAVESSDGAVHPTVLWVVIVAMLNAIGYLFLDSKRQQRTHQEEITKTRAEYDAQLEPLRQREGIANIRIAHLQAEVLRLSALIEQLQVRGGIPLDTFTVAQITVDGATGLIAEWNPAATMLFKFPQREALMKPIDIIIPPEYREKHHQAFNKLLVSGGAPRKNPGLFVAMAKDGERIPIEISLNAFHDGPRLMIGAILRRREEELNGNAAAH